MARCAPYLVSLLSLVLILLAVAPVQRGVRCRFWMTRPSSPRSFLDESARPGLCRREFAHADFSAPTSLTIDPRIDHLWSGSSAPTDRSFRWTGWVYVPKEGSWSVGTTSDDGSFVCVDDRVVATNWSDHQPLSRWGRVWLSRGFHRLRVDYYQRTGIALCRLMWKPPGEEPQLIPPGLLRQTRGPARLPDKALIVPASRAKSSSNHELEPSTRGVFDQIAPVSSVDPALERWAAERLDVSTDPEPWELKDPGVTSTVGWTWADYSDGWDEESLTAAGTGHPTLPESPEKGERPEGTVRVFRTYLTTSWTSTFRFRLAKGSPSVLLIDDKPVMGLPGVPVRGPAEARWTLAMGTHSIRLTTVTTPTTATSVTPDLSISPVVGPFDPRPRFSLGSSPALLGTGFPADISLDGPPLLEEWQPNIHFMTGMALAVPYIHRWDVKRHGHPANLAPLRATWDGVLDCPLTGTYTFTLRGTGRILLRVGSDQLYKGLETHETSMKLYIPSGKLPLTLEAHEPGLIRQVGLFWKLPEGREEPISSCHFVSPWASERFVQQRGLSVAALALLIAALFATGGPFAYARFLRTNAALHTWVLLLLIGVTVRLHDYTRVPGPGDTDDEFNHHLEGTSLAFGQVPIGWDQHLGFPLVQAIPFYGRVFRIVAPMVFYPPVFTVLVGELNRAAGAVDPFEARIHVTRLLPIGLSCLTLMLIWPVARSVGIPTSAALLATGFLALYPSGVMLGRLIKEENLVTPLYLGIVWILSGYGSSSGFGRRLALGSIIVLCILTKQMGVSSALLAFVVLCRKGHYRAGVLMLFYALFAALCFLWYGLAWGGQSFIDLQKEHLVYATRLDAVWPLLAENKITDPVVGSSWVLGLWLAFVLFSVRQFRSRPQNLVSLAGVCYLVVLVVCYPPDRNYGWYRLPLLPLLALAWGVETRRMFHCYDIVRAILWVGLFVLPCTEMIHGLDRASQGVAPPVLKTSGPPSTEGMDVSPTVMLRIVVVGLVLPSILLGVLPRPARRFLSFLMTTAVVALIAIGFAIVVWRWGDLFPPVWGWDPIRQLDMNP